MKRLMVVFVCVVVVVAAGTVWAEPYRILHKQGAIYDTDTGWNLNTPPYYPGNDWAVDLVADSEGVTILHKDGAMWNDTGGWDMNTPPYYPGSEYARALDAGPEEVRIPISSLPFTISQSGSYYITGDLTSAGDGIIVNADDVTIDLMGYSLIGPGSGENYGIYMNTRSNVEIRNGTVTNFGDNGIYEASFSGTNHRVIDVRAVGNGGYGIEMRGLGSLIKDCTVSDNSNYGCRAADGSTVTGSTAYNNGGYGIRADAGCTVTGNTAYNNGSYGISASSGCTVTGNTAYDNGSTGIDTGYGCTIIGNTVRDNDTHGLTTGHACTVMGNAAFNNDYYGIQADEGCTVTGNTAHNNGAQGISAEVGSTVTGNTAYFNQYHGIYLVGGNNFVDGNTAYDNNQSSGGFSNISACASCTFGTNHAP